MPIRIDTAYRNKTLSEITEYIYELDSLFNKFYGERSVLNETDELKKESYIGLLNIMYNVGYKLLNILAIGVPEKM